LATNFPLAGLLAKFFVNSTEMAFLMLPLEDCLELFFKVENGCKVQPVTHAGMIFSKGSYSVDKYTVVKE
jgi:hypothetical protein